VRFDGSAEAYVSEEDIRAFIRKELGRRDLAIYSFEILGY